MRSIRLAALAPLLVAGALTTLAPSLTAQAAFAVNLSGAALPRVAHHATHGRVAAARLHTTRATRQQRHTAPAAAVSTEKAQMLNLINAERRQAGAGPLSFDPALNAIAQGRSEDMVARHYFSHQIPGGGMVFDILDRQHVQYTMAGENIALNNYIDFYSMTRTIAQTNTDLMNSPEHRANILEHKYTKIGLGVAFEHGTGKLILTEVFVQP